MIPVSSHGLSIIDLIFNMGRNQSNYLEGVTEQ